MKCQFYHIGLFSSMLLLTIALLWKEAVDISWTESFAVWGSYSNVYHWYLTHSSNSTHGEYLRLFNGEGCIKNSSGQLQLLNWITSSDCASSSMELPYDMNVSNLVAIIRHAIDINDTVNVTEKRNHSSNLNHYSPIC